MALDISGYHKLAHQVIIAQKIIHISTVNVLGKGNVDWIFPEALQSI